MTNKQIIRAAAERLDPATLHQIAAAHHTPEEIAAVAASCKIVDKDGTEITDENLVQFKGADGKYKAVKSGSVVEVVFDKNVNIGLTSTGNGYKITKYTITDASTSKVKTATESNCSDFNFKVTKEGVSEIEIRLEVK